jgi:uncharacterized membrane protein
MRSYMNQRLIFVVTLCSALGCGLVAGIFFAFSTFVMKALGKLPPPQGIAAMQSINVVVINPLFLATFLGTTVLCAVLAGAALFRWHEPGAAWLLAGGLLYVVGTFLVTVVFNVPRNNALAAADPASTDGASLWARYLVSWTAWNHVRTAAAFVASALLIIALWLQAKQSL